MKAIIVYHRADFDGIGSMLVAHQALSMEDPDIDTIDLKGWNYGDEVPNVTTELGAEYDIIIMVDISFPPEAMMELVDLQKVGVNTFWIDHHITAINDSIKYGYDVLPGLRYNGVAAIENTWEFFFPKQPAPAVVQLLGTYDVWNKTRYDWEGLVLPLQFALRAKYGLSITDISQDWPTLVTSSFDELEPLIESGRLILSFLRRNWESVVKNYSWEVIVDGKYRGIACMSTEFSSNLFGEKSKEYDVMIVIDWYPKNQMFKTSMYVDPDRESAFSAGEYMKEHYRGGGHKGAAGGQLTQDEFLRLINDCQI